jgi:hypothetical protein
MNFRLFADYFPDLAEEETRTILVPEDSPTGLPAAAYSFLEMFCDQKGCDCRRVFFYVTSSRMHQDNPAAVISYGWESRKFYGRWIGTKDPSVIQAMMGPALNLGSPQSDLAKPLLKLAKSVLLKDPAYIDRLKRHYRTFKDQVNARR